jgi:hypothetical protein
MPFSTLVGLGVFFVFHGNTGAIMVTIVKQVIVAPLSIAYWIIVFRLGWPLFKDAVAGKGEWPR